MAGSTTVVDQHLTVRTIARRNKPHFQYKDKLVNVFRQYLWLSEKAVNDKDTLLPVFSVV